MFSNIKPKFSGEYGIYASLHWVWPTVLVQEWLQPPCETTQRTRPIPMLREDVFWQEQTKSAHVFKTILWNRSRCVGAFLHIRQVATNFINSITCTSCEYIVRWISIFFSLLNVYKLVSFIFIFHNRLLFEYSEWYSKQTVVTNVNS